MYNRSEIFAKAHRWYKQGMRSFNGVRVSFSECLKNAWYAARKVVMQKRAFAKLDDASKALVLLKQQAQRNTVYLPAHMSMVAEERRIQQDINAIVGLDWFDLDARTL